ncbi:CHAT domain-containing protein [Pedobacter sp. BS3]|uniref:CHAT domain-containing protein n=1 Tax=Pedobacter sp. BS3 TaxID=2567937 RepID=UPI0011EE20A0|nr:CHAT domain-containing protein [Pedobacter sp. BS3]TZF82165.1 CHAT domain-containing protein [Pedobacter sp. BS3]
MVKKRIFILLLVAILAPLAGYSQDFNARFQEAWQLSNAGKPDEALPKFQALLKEAPGYSGVHVQISWIYLLKNDLTQASAYADNAYQLYQMDIGATIIKAYVLYAQNRKSEGLGFLNLALWLDPDGNNLPAVEKDLNDIIAHHVNPAVFNEVLTYVKTAHPARNKTFIQINALINEAVQQINAKKYTPAKSAFDKALGLFAQVPAEFQFLRSTVAFVAAQNFFNAANDYDFPYAMQSLDMAKSYPGKIMATAQLSAAAIVLSHYQRVNDYEKGVSFGNAYWKLVPAAINYGNEKANFLYYYATLMNGVQQSDPTALQSLKVIAETLSKVQNTTSDAWYQANASNFLGIAYVASPIPVDRKKAAFYFQQALNTAKLNNLDALYDEFTPNTAISLWQQGDKEKAKQLYVEAAEKARAKGDLGLAESSYNNAGALYYQDKNFAAAIPLLQKAADITEQLRSTLKGREKILYFQQHVSAFELLVASYARLGNGKAVFDIQNKDRARVLGETLKKRLSSPVTLEKFQAKLKADEAALFYSQMEAGAFIINVVTKESATPVYIEDFQHWVDVKKKYLDRIHQADGKASGYKPATGIIEQSGIKYQTKDVSQMISRNDMDEIMQLTRECLQDVQGQIPASVTADLLASYYRTLISPVLSRITGKSKLIISPSGILNFLPYEALLAPDNHFLIENFDIRYCQSADVFNTVHERVYPASRKSFLGMGGAIYQDMSEQAQPLRGQEQLVNLQEIAEQNLFNNKPQREIYAALFGSKKMNYLAGTLQEVKNLSNIFQDRDVFFGADMTENRIKQMSATGQLKNYKVIHLATHGFAVPEIPELSGVAMCIFNQMQGNEDGYLTAPEISGLHMQADIAVLSACETALGKIYGGEGVSGLTGSLLTAGANRALVSLWPVSDEGTMYYMTGLYTMTTKEGKSYEEAASIMKRRFIRGDFGQQFRHFNFWAPYVLYGM